MRADLIKELVTAELIGASSPYAIRAHIVDLCAQLAAATEQAEKAETASNLLAARVAELEAALKQIQAAACPLGSDRGDLKVLGIAERALLSTASQSLALVKAEALREAYVKVCAAAVVAEEKNSTTFTWSDAAVLINDEADRLEAEVKEKETNNAPPK